MDSFVLFADIAMIIIAATIISAVMKKLKQPALLAYIIAGIILGPMILGKTSFDLFGTIIHLGTSTVTPEIKLLSSIGAALLLFSIGTETSIKRLMNVGKPILAGTFAQVIAIIALTLLLTVPFGFLKFEQALFVGTIISFSSTMIVVKILSDKGEVNNLNGRLMISILLIQDFLVVFFVPLLANISSINNFGFILLVLGKSALLIAIAFILNKFFFPRLFKIAANEQELFMLASIATAFAFIGISDFLGIPIAIGAFIGGLALSTLPYNQDIFTKIRALRDFFLTIFFVSLGMQINFSFTTLPLATMLIIAGIIFIAKPIVLFALMLLAGYGSKIGARIGLMLAQVSEFGFELAGIGAITLTANGTNIITPELFSFLITIIALSMIITPYIANSSSKVSAFVYKKTRALPKEVRRPFFSRKISELERQPTKKELKDHIIIVGGGTIGRALAKGLMPSNQVLILDHDPEVVIQGQKDNLPYLYGHSESENLWDKVDLKDAKLLVITILNKKEALALIQSAKEFSKKITIFATAHYFGETLEYYKNGVDFVAMPLVMGSNIFLKNISAFIDKGKLFHIQNYKDEYLEYVEKQAAEEKAYKHKGFEL